MIGAVSQVEVVEFSKWQLSVVSKSANFDYNAEADIKCLFEIGLRFGKCKISAL